MLNKNHIPQKLYTVEVNFREKTVESLEIFPIQEVSLHIVEFYDLNNLEVGLQEKEHYRFKYNNVYDVSVPVDTDFTSYIHEEEHLATTVNCNPVVSATYYIFDEKLKEELSDKIKQDLENYEISIR